MDTLTHQATQQAKLAAIAQDDRYQYSAALMTILSTIATELAKIRQPLAEMDEQLESPATALSVLAALGQSKRIHRPAAVIDNLLTQARSHAVNLARANGATWEQVGEALGIPRQNACEVYGK